LDELATINVGIRVPEENKPRNISPRGATQLPSSPVFLLHDKPRIGVQPGLLLLAEEIADAISADLQLWIDQDGLLNRLLKTHLFFLAGRQWARQGDSRNQ